MIDNENGLFCMFMKIKPSILQGTKSEDTLEFFIDCYKYLHKMGIAKKYGVEFVFI